MFLGAIANGEGVCPLAIDGVERIFLLSCWVQASCEGVLLSRQPALSRVIDFGSVTCRGDDVACFVEFDVWIAVDKTFDMERWKGNEVCLIERSDFQKSMSNLFDLNGA